MAKEKKMLLGYGDGSGNSYSIFEKKNKKFIEYDPITKEMSSSGYYDGGSYKLNELSDSSYKEIVTAAQAAIKQTSDHAKSRMKGTGEIRFLNTKTKKRFVLKYGSKSQKDFETALKKALK